MTLTYLFLLILILIRVVTGTRLFLTARRNHLPNLMWLSASMFMTALLLLFTPTPGNPLAAVPFGLWVFTGGAIAGEAFLIMFNHLTFYKDRESPVLGVWIFFLVCAGISLYGVSLSPSSATQSVWSVAHIFAAVVIWAWHGGLAYQAWARVAGENSVQDWVKTRYRLIVSYSVVLGVGSTMSIIRFIIGENGALVNLISVVGLLTQIISIVLMFLVWVMPERFRLWLNRNQQKHADQQVYQQASAILDILGTGMSHDTNLPKTLALVTLRRMIARQINTEDSKKIESHVVKLGYDDWYSFLEQPELSIFLKEVANVNPSGVLKNAKNTLIENQSLFTIQAQ